MEDILTENDLEKLRARIDELYSCSERMLQAAKQGAWEEVTQLENERKNIELLPNITSYDDEIKSEIQQRLQSVLDMNKQVMYLATDARDVLANKLAALKNGSNAAAQYKKF
ncbi:MAG: flagellar protein FliT [Pseudomonadota bacterium]